MLAKTARADDQRHAYVEGVHTRTGRDGRIYRLCRVCDDRANAWPHRGFRTTKPTPREKAPHHPFDPSATFLEDVRGHKQAACVVCGKAKRATEHGGISAPLPTLDKMPALRALAEIQPEAFHRPLTPSREKMRIPDAEIALLAISIDRVLALPTDVVGWTLRLRLDGVRSLLDVPIFPTLDPRLTEEATPDETPGHVSDEPVIESRPLPASNGVASRGILAGIRNDRVRELVKRATASGWDISKTGSGHLALSRGDRRLIMSSTIGDGRRGHSWANTRAEAKRQGIDVSGL